MSDLEAAEALCEQAGLSKSDTDQIIASGIDLARVSGTSLIHAVRSLLFAYNAEKQGATPPAQTDRDSL